MGKKDMLTVDQILDSVDFKEEVIEIKEWGGSVKIRSLNIEQMQRIRKNASLVEDGEIDEERFGMLLFIEGVSEPKFDESHIEKLKTKNLMAYGRVITRLQELCGLGGDEVKEAKKLFT